jgi:hypothetical protein
MFDVIGCEDWFFGAVIAERVASEGGIQPSLLNLCLKEQDPKFLQQKC